MIHIKSFHKVGEGHGNNRGIGDEYQIRTHISASCEWIQRSMSGLSDPGVFPHPFRERAQFVIVGHGMKARGGAQVHALLFERGEIVVIEPRSSDAPPIMGMVDHVEAGRKGPSGLIRAPFIPALQSH